MKACLLLILFIAAPAWSQSLHDLWSDAPPKRSPAQTEATTEPTSATEPVVAAPVPAPPEPEVPSPELENLRLRVDALEQKLATQPPPATLEPLNMNQTFTGLSAVASKVYFQKSDGWVFGLNADFFSYHQRNGSLTNNKPNLDRSNVVSIAPLLAYRLNSRLYFNSLISLNNGGAESGSTVAIRKGEAVVTMAYLDVLWNEQSGVRFGHQFLPIGVVNTTNGGFSFFGVLRPELERELIPSPWHENGILFWMQSQSLEVQAGAFSSLDASQFKNDTFLGGGKGQGQNSPSEDIMGAGRIQWKNTWSGVGASIAFGNSAQRNNDYHNGGFQLAEVHAKISTRRVEVFAMSAVGQLQDAEAISLKNSTVMPERATGVSGHMAVEVLNSEKKLWLFTRHSRYDLQDRVPDSLTPDASLNKTQTTIGLSFLPLPNFVAKADYAFKKSAARDDDDEFSLGLSAAF